MYVNIDRFLEDLYLRSEEIDREDREYKNEMKARSKLKMFKGVKNERDKHS